MQQKLSLRLKPSEVADEATVNQYIASATGTKPSQVTGFRILKRSLDARSRQPWINLTVQAFIDEPFHPRDITRINFRDASELNHRVIIIGAGPAGLFAALKCLELGVKPVVLERGKDVRARRRDLAQLNKEGIVNPESNYCFGEGGAGTYSDGKLYTRSNKRGSIDRVLNLLVQFGAEEEILYDAHPHIGTNKLPQIITAMRHQVTGSGGEFHFGKKVIGLQTGNGSITGVTTADGDNIKGDAIILATGHSARDIFRLLHEKDILVEAKPFALGVRVEHPQSLIDSIQYHCPLRDPLLPPASYSLVEQVNEKGVFSFCMCPGGIIAPASTEPDGLVVNGWSPSKRNNPYANSGMVVSVDIKDAVAFFKTKSKGERSKGDANDPLLLMEFQNAVEKAAFTAGGGLQVAPAQRLVDFCNDSLSVSLPDCSYLPGIRSVDLRSVLPSFVHNNLVQALKAFGKKMRGYYTNDAVVVATESRTSSPVRIPRNETTLEHPQVAGLYPCGEGAGYAGGIVSAAMDGEKVAAMICDKLLRTS
ncbi:MAG: NAD(FAD)-utilizing dehydrogenase [Chitinophagaceae bacterium]|nr:NAD(FAD)-utilizing dehydrogenase [Chitinophagaceae bacterium]